MARSFHLMLKPAGALCNLACDYCFFSHKTALLNSNAVMDKNILERLIRDYIASQRDDVVVFSWQGGEPTLAGLDFFRYAVQLQKKYCPPGRHIENDLQTNGTLLTDEWFAFLKENRFLVGLSIDGPPDIHNLHRKGREGDASAEKVVRCAAKLKEFEIPFNTLTAVNHDNAEYPLEVYRYLRDVIDSQHIQFLPVVEPRGYATDAPGFWEWSRLGTPEQLENFVTPWSVRPMQYGRFLTGIFREWNTRDRGRRFIYPFEALLGIWSGFRSTICTLAPECGDGLALDRDGSLYSCDRFCYKEYRLGQIQTAALGQVADSMKQTVFRRLKRALPPQCRTCKFLFACHGGCPKNRFALTSTGEPGLNYLCSGWKFFLSEIEEDMKQMSAELNAALKADMHKN